MLRGEAAARTDHSSDCCCPWIPGWNKPVEVGIQRQRQALTLLQNDSVRSAAPSTSLRVEAELGEGAAHKMPHLPKGDGKACSTAFYRRPRSREGCRICAANSPLPSRERAGSRSEALNHRIRAQRSTCAQQGEARMLAARHAVLRPRAEWYCGDMRVKTLFCTNVKALLDESLCEQAFIQRNALTSL